MDWRRGWDPRLPQHADFGDVDFDPFDEPYNPPSYGDWWKGSHPFDDNDRRDFHPRSGWTGLPPKKHQGVQYEIDDWAATNGDQGPGHYYHINDHIPRRHNGKPPRKAFVWPIDGKRKSTWGRWKDIGSSKGPDIFVTNLGNRPTRNHWKNRFQDWDPENDERWEDTLRAAPWARRSPAKHYNFYSRKYQWDKPGRYTWSDAIWPRHDADQHDFPLSYRCKHDEWYNMRWAPFGGVPLPEQAFHRRKGDRKRLWK